jgi:Na+-driven multidrug efflux pump
MWALGSITTLALFVLAATPLAYFWFGKVSALSPELSELGRKGIWIALPMPFLATLQSWYQGAILYGRQTRGITESVVIYLLTSALILVAGVSYGRNTGLYFGLLALTASMTTQTIWLWYRSREVRHRLAQAAAGG